MADAVVEFLLDNLKRLLLYNAELISGLKGQVESLYKELSLMKAFLKDSKEKRSEYEYVRELVRQIRDVAYEAEDIIDTFVVNAVLQKERSTFSKMVHVFDHPAKLRSVAKDIESIKEKVKEIYEKNKFGIEALYAGESSKKPSSLKRRTPEVEEDNVIGFDEEAQEVVSQLTNINESLEVVSVVGMGGLGKTTLAKKVYCDPAIEFHFFVRGWVHVSQEYNRKEVLFAILGSITQPSDHTNSKMSEEMIIQEICKNLNGRRYLIVLDDVWTTDAWNDLKTAFPNQDCGSRILLTTRNTEVALLANPYTSPHHLRFLNEDESFKLLSTKVFRKRSCPFELVELGKTIAKKCDGLPLALVVIAGLLLKKDKTRDQWKKVAESVGSYVARDPKQCLDVLALSYKQLPDHLKVCFIYFGAFPEDFPIPVWKLVMLWVAEGFIQENGQECLEDLAEEYLEDLVERNLILIAKRRANGRIKTCRVHDMLRDLCLREAAEEKFLQVIKRNIQDQTSLISPVNYRRLCVHSHVMNFIHSKPSGPHVRSFLCFPLEETELSREHTSFIHEAFMLVRVLDIKSINISRFPVEITQLVHLRYISIFGNFKVLPPSIAKLWSLQSLVVETTARELDIQVDIWKMLQFRHLRTNGSSCLHGPQAKTRMDNEDPFVQGNIQTISTISPGSCTENILARTPNLKKLGIRGKLVVLMELKKNASLFANLAKLDNLEKLKLLNDTFPRPPSEGKLRALPPSYKFPPHLNKLTLSDTLLDWKHMSTIAMLPYLEVLKLKVYAFTGPQWDPLDGGFRLLKYLLIGKTDLVHWNASGHHFPRLEHIVVEQCCDLEALPHGLKDLSTLQTMELRHTPSAIRSARLIEGHKKMQSSGFKLLIYPPE
ncbi:putative late blight resistance protein homolog R1B-14 [Bidens hawaiensis]|uniref:putative late blight resistance protein homolog R1B-14 n=1 Tax=Bidens hawaiensis TaxID=980011 RepID=UPI00404A5183